MTRREKEARVVRAAMAAYAKWRRENPSAWTLVVGLNAPVSITGLTKQSNALIKSCAALARKGRELPRKVSRKLT